MSVSPAFEVKVFLPPSDRLKSCAMKSEPAANSTLACEIGRLGHQGCARSDVDTAAFDLQRIYSGMAVDVNLADHIHLVDRGGALLVELRRLVGELHIAHRQFTVFAVLERRGRIEFQFIGRNLAVVEQAARVGILEIGGRKHGFRTVVELQGVVQVQFSGDLDGTQIDGDLAGEVHLGGREFAAREYIQRRPVLGDVLSGQFGPETVTSPPGRIASVA